MKAVKFLIIILLISTSHANASSKSVATFLTRTVAEGLRVSSLQKAHQFDAYNILLDLSYGSLGIISNFLSDQANIQAMHMGEPLEGLVFNPQVLLDFEEKHSLGFERKALVLPWVTRISESSSSYGFHANVFWLNILNSNTEVSILDILLRNIESIEYYTLAGFAEGGEEGAIENFTVMLRAITNIYTCVSDKLSKEANVKLGQRLDAFMATALMLESIIASIMKTRLSDVKESIFEMGAFADITVEFGDLTFSDIFEKHIKFKNINQHLQVPANDLTEDLIDVFGKLHVELVRILIEHREEHDLENVPTAIQAMLTSLKHLGLVDSELENSLINGRGLLTYFEKLTTFDEVFVRAGFYELYHIDDETGEVIGRKF